MTISTVIYNLKKNGWPDATRWYGGTCGRVYVKSLKGYDCGFIQFTEHGVNFGNLSKHQDLIKKAAKDY